MFDFGFSELVVIAIVALVVLGPERLPKAARFAGLWVRRARNQWDSVKQELERELQAEEIKKQMQEVRQSMQDTGNELRASGEAARRQMQDLDAQGRTLADEVRADDAPATAVAAAAAIVKQTVDAEQDTTRELPEEWPSAAEHAANERNAQEPRP